ncbi:MAG TPA: hypothetical protein ENI23_07880 [bacterium]|nr:hypothetical protein [bacterium]
MPTIKRSYEKLKRNSICPCGSNMKYKNCCLKKIQDQEQQAYMMIHHNKRIAGAKKNVAAAIQHDIDHPIILTDRKITVPDSGCSDIILP